MEVDFEWERPDFDWSNPRNARPEGIFEVEFETGKLMIESSVQELLQFATIYENSPLDNDIELYLFICTILFRKTLEIFPSDETVEISHLEIRHTIAQGWLDRAIDVAWTWLENTTRDDKSYRHRLELFKAFSMMGNQRKAMEDDIEAEYQQRLDLQRRILEWDEAFLRTGQASALEKSIELLGRIDPLCPVESPSRAWYFSTLAKALAYRYALRHDRKDIDEAVRLSELAVNHKPYHPQRRMMKLNLATWLWSRFKWTSSLDDLNRSVRLGREALREFTGHGQEEAVAQVMYASILGNSAEHLGELDSLSEAISLAETGLQTMDHKNGMFILYKSNLAGFLAERSHQTNKLDDLNRAIKILQDLARETPAHHLHHRIVGNNLISLHWNRFQRKGDYRDLNRAILLGQRFLQEEKTDTAEGAIYLSNLALSYGARWEHRGDRKDLDLAIQLARRAVKCTTPGHTMRPIFLNTLGNILGRRFEVVGAMSDIDQSIKVLQEAIRTSVTDSEMRRGHQMITLGYQYSNRFSRTKKIEDINEAIKLVEKALTTVPEGTSDWANWTANLSKWLGQRYASFHDVEDGKRAGDAAFAASRKMSKDEPYRGFCLTLCAGEIAGGDYPEALPNAIEIAEMALESTPTDHPEQANRLFNLGLYHQLLALEQPERYSIRRGQLHVNIEEAVSYFQRSLDCNFGGTLSRVRAAKRGADILADQSKWQEASEFLKKGILLVPKMSPRMLNNADKQAILIELAGLASMSAAILLSAGNSPYEALSHLELGRGVIAGHLLDMRTDISKIERLDTALAKRFRSLRNDLDAPSFVSEMDASYTSSVTLRDEAEKELAGLVREIRKLDGFSNFLLPSREEELTKAAVKGPVIVLNVTDYRSDAFILTEGQPIRTLALAITEDEVVDMAKDLRTSEEALSRVLVLLWYKIANPVLTELGFTTLPSDRNWPRVWWIPTGRLTNFPIHAAGIHVEGSTDTVLDKVISSYSSSIRALVHGRETHQAELPEHAKIEGDAVLIAMEKTPASKAHDDSPTARLNLRPPRLLHANEEIELVRDLCGSIGLKPVKPEPLRDNVLSSLGGGNCRLFHFAGHGLSDPIEPSQGCLLLEDWEEKKLTVAHIRDLRLQDEDVPPFLAFLAACSTGTNDVETLVDEGINLVSACHLAGFGHVIGTLWEVWDQHSVSLAKKVYETVRDEGMTDDAVARGLHFAVRALRGGAITASVLRRSGEDIPADLIDEVGGDDENGSEQYEDGTDQDASGDATAESRNPRRKRRAGILRANRNNPLVWAPYMHVGG